MKKLLKALFAWLFGKWIADELERDTLTKSKYEDSELGKSRREKFLKDLRNKNKGGDDE